MPQPGEHVRRHEAPDHGRRCAPRPRSATTARGRWSSETGRTWRFCAVERHGEEALVLHPEALVEGALEARGAPAPAARRAPRRRAARRRPRGAAWRSTRSPASRRARWAPRPACRRRAARRRPASRQPWLRRPDARAALVLDEPVAVGVAAGRRSSRARRRRPRARSSNPSRSPVHIGELGDQQQPQRRRVHGAEVRRVRDGAHGGELAAPQLVHDLAGLLLAEGAVLRALAAAQERRPPTAPSAGRAAASRGRRTPSRGRTAPRTTAARRAAPARRRSPWSSMRRSSWPRRSARLSCSLSVKMSVASDSQRSCSRRRAPMRALNSPPALARRARRRPPGRRSGSPRARRARRCRRNRARPCLMDSGGSWKRTIVWRVTSSSPR